jgi:hypothetical protein
VDLRSDAAANARVRTGDPPPVLRSTVRTLVLGLLLAYLSTFYHHPPRYSFVDDGILDNAVMALSAVVCLGRAVLVRGGCGARCARRICWPASAGTSSGCC